jgi:transcriptional regulator with XRE-family HTH domain
MKKAETYKSPFIDALLKDISTDESLKIEKRMLLAARIDDAIKAKGWKQKDLAKALKKSPSEISKWLSGTHNLTSDSIFDLERVLGIRIINLENKQDNVIKTYRYNITVQTSNYVQMQEAFFNRETKPAYRAKAHFKNCHS